MMAAMESTRIYFERNQKKALEQKANVNGWKVGEEVRRAVDAYLGGNLAR
jgi:hypothetical protein